MRVFIGSASALVLAFTLSAGPNGPGRAHQLRPRAARHAAAGRDAAAGWRPGRRRPADAAGGPDPARVIPGGGVLVQGWTGKIDAAEAANGQVLNNSKLSQEGAALHVETGPATTYWNPANRATGTYTVKATFTEPKYMSANSHPHPYGIMIAGNDLGTPQQSYLYCSAYGNGNFIVRGFGPSESADDGHGVQHDRPRRRERGRAQGGGPGPAGDAGHRRDGQGRQRRVRHQRHGRGDLSEGRPRGAGQAEVHGRRLRHPVRAQHRRDGDRPHRRQVKGASPGAPRDAGRPRFLVSH